MKWQIAPSVWSSNGMAVLRCLPAVLALVAVSDRYALAADEFQDLVRQIPRSANAIILLNMEKAKSSPLGLKEGWKEKVEEAFTAGLVPVPPQATRFVLSSQIDYEFKEPLWEAAVIDLDAELSMDQIAKLRGGTPDRIEGLAALARPNDTYIVQLGPKRIAAMGPGNRQTVVRWIREVRKPSPPPLSPYLQKAALYSDESGSQIIMALDLEGVMSFERVGKYLSAHEVNLQKWQPTGTAPMRLTDMANLLSSVQGVRVGVRIGEQPSGKIAVDLSGDASAISPVAKPLLLQVLSDSGALINDFQSWTVQAKGSEISLAGKLTTSGLRRLLSVIDSPVSGDLAADQTPGTSPGDAPAVQAKKSREYFRAVVAMADDLKDDMKKAANLASTQLFFDKYARRIERMPILGVDEALVDYGALVAGSLRQATGSMKTMGIQTNVRETQTTGGGVHGADYGYNNGYEYGGYRYGAYGGYAGDRANLKAVGAQRRVVRAEEEAAAATDAQQLRQAMISATADIRRKMTQKYQVEF
jgi:hypothetical protein